jgi:hypothetical protein
MTVASVLVFDFSFCVRGGELPLPKAAPSGHSASASRWMCPNIASSSNKAFVCSRIFLKHHSLAVGVGVEPNKKQKRTFQ